MKRVLFITTSNNDLGESRLKTGIWLEEVATPYYRLREESIHVEIASVHGGNIPIDSVSESKDWMTEDIDKYLLEDIIPFMLYEELIKQEAIFSHTKPFESYLVNDGNLVIGQKPAPASNAGLKTIYLLAN